MAWLSMTLCFFADPILPLEANSSTNDSRMDPTVLSGKEWFGFFFTLDFFLGSEVGVGATEGVL